MMEETPSSAQDEEQQEPTVEGTSPRRSVGLGGIAAVAVVALLVGGVVGFQAGKSSPELVRRPDQLTTPPVELSVGETAETSTGTTVQVLTWEPGTPPGWPDPGPDYQPSRAIVRFCAAPGGWTYRVRQLVLHFELVTESGAVVEPVFDNAMMPEEFAGTEERISSDECVTGSLIFQDPGGQGIASVDAVRFNGFERYDWDVSQIADGTMDPPQVNEPFGVSSNATTPTI